MRRTQLIALTGYIVLALSATAGAQDAIAWTSNLMQARQAAAQQRRLLLLHFWATDCPPCQALEYRVFNRPEVARAISVNYVPVKINANQAPDLARRYGVRQWPTDVILAADGTELYRSVSSQNPNQYIALLDQLAANYRVAGDTQLAAQAVRASGMPTAAPGRPGAYGDRGSPFPTSGPTPASSPSAGSAYAAAAPNPTPWRQPAPATRAAFPSPSPAALAAGPSNVYNRSAPASRPNYSASAYSPNTATPWNAPAAAQPAPPSPQPVTNPWAASAPIAPRAEPTYSHTASAPAASPAPPEAAIAATPQRPAPTAPSAAPPAAAPAPRPQPPVALDGYCPVTLLEQQKWVRADPRWGVVHRDRTYLFAGRAEQQKFLADPDRYAPVLSGYDPVVYSERKQWVEGSREHGVFYRNRVYLFADEGSLQRFWQAPDRYARFVEQAMQPRSMNR